MPDNGSYAIAAYVIAAIIVVGYVMSLVRRAHH